MFDIMAQQHNHNHTVSSMDSRGARIAALGLQMLENEKQKLALTQNVAPQIEKNLGEANLLDQYYSDIINAELVINGQGTMLNNNAGDESLILIEGIEVGDYYINATADQQGENDKTEEDEDAIDQVQNELYQEDDNRPRPMCQTEETQNAIDQIEEAVDQEEAMDQTEGEYAIDQPEEAVPVVDLTKQGLPRKRKKGSVFTPHERKLAKIESMKLKHPVHPPCEKCKKKCNDKISQDRRVELNTQFWGKSWMERRIFILSMCTKLQVARRTSGSGEVAKRQNSFKYTLKGADNVQEDVCKTFFLTTLGFTKNNDTVLHNILCDTPSNAIFPNEDNRGKRPRIAEKNERAIISLHIESFKPSVSHYRREHAPNKRYLPSDITKTFMHADFVVKNPSITCSYERYRNVLKEKNISFTKLGHEECEQCEYFAQHDPAHKKESLDASCEKCCTWEKHITRAQEARIKYRGHAEAQHSTEDQIVFSADLQKVIMLPRMETFKSVVFTRRIVAFNESFVPVGGKSQNGLKPMAVIWHEGVAGRKKEDIISAFHAFFLQYRDVKKIILWLDNCSAQNKNWALFTYFVFLLNCEMVELQSLEINYFEPGHTFMSADSFHHQVELSMAKKGKLYDFDDFQDSVQSCNLGKVTVKAMKPDNFSDWKDQSSLYKLNKQTPRPMLSDMVQVLSLRGDKSLHYRDSYNGPIKNLNFLNAKSFKSSINVPISKVNYRGIPKEKKNDIVSKLLPLMPESRKKFWNDIPITDSLDLTDNIDD